MGNWKWKICIRTAAAILAISTIPYQAEAQAAPRAATIQPPQVAAGGCPRADQLISSEGAGTVRLGMTVAEVRTALPGTMIGRTTDGEGMALIEAKMGEDLIMILYAGELDSEAPPQESAKVEGIWVYSDTYKTSEGVCTGMLLDEAARLLGGSPELIISEIESREYANFPGQNPRLEFRTYGGIYPQNERQSTKYSPDAAISSIAVYSP